ncbi:MAG: cation diffusion facilitator family transporter [Lautropia sp.]|nr:cation diffusion facilitator family transporter [Lautropia sp.]
MAHVFSQGNPLAERRTRWVMILTLIVMVAEILGGWAFNSMALLADGWHMSSHALAMGLAVFAYRMAARHARNPRFSFGTWKIEILGGYTSALLLAGVAVMMLWHSVERLMVPLPIQHEQAIGTAVLGLVVNIVSAWMLKDSDHHHHHHGHSHSHGHAHARQHAHADDGHHHGQAHSHSHDDHHAQDSGIDCRAEHEHDGHAHSHSRHHHHAHAHEHEHEHGQKGTSDLNLRAAYVHVLADAATSILAILALFGSMFWGADWLDPVMGIAGAVLVGVWAKGLLADCARVLLDAEMDAPLVGQIRRTLAAAPVPNRLDDLHLWRVAHDRHACMISLSVPPDALLATWVDGKSSAGAEAESTESVPVTAEFFRNLLSRHASLAHVTVEINADHHLALRS